MIRRRKRERMNAQPPGKVICHGHGKYVRGFTCALAGVQGIGPLGTPIGAHECEGRIEAHHETTRGAGGGDETQVPLCAKGHRNIHDGCCFNTDLGAVARRLWKSSPHRIKFENDWRDLWGDTPLPYRRAATASAQVGNSVEATTGEEAHHNKDVGHD